MNKFPETFPGGKYLDTFLKIKASALQNDSNLVIKPWCIIIVSSYFETDK